MDSIVSEYSDTHWFSSSYSFGNASPVLSFTPDGWQAFTTHIKTTD